MAKRPGTMSGDDRALSGLAERRQTPASGVPVVPWHNEDTGVHTDPQVFRAMKGLHEEIQASKREAANAHSALRTELTARIDKLETESIRRSDKLEGKLDDTNTLAATVSGKMDVLLATRRDRSSSSETRTVVTQTIAERILDDDMDRRRTRRKFWLTVAKGLFSGAVIVEAIHILAGYL